MRILTGALKTILAFKAAGFEKATKDPISAQKKLLIEFLQRNKDTLYGREYSFGAIQSIDEFQKRVPINDYEAFRPYIERLLDSENNILTKDAPILFGTTSGTTGTPKYIPVTDYSKQKKKEVIEIWVYHILKDYPDILDGKILAIVSPEVESRTPSGIPCGAETGHAYKNLPYLIRLLYALPYRVVEIKDYAAKYYCMLRLAMEQDISTIATMNPSTIVLLCQKIADFKEKIIDDIHKGTLSADFAVPDDIRKDIEKNLEPNPERAYELEALLKEHGALLPRHIWPNIKLIECWKAGTVGLYLNEFPKYFGDTPVRDFGYVASEARCSIPTEDDRCCGVLAINTNFYEFIPREDRNKEAKRLLLCDQLEEGKEYFIIITTPGGLYRYDIDDVVKVTGFHNSTPRIEFVQKGLNVSSLTGEKLYESHIVEAVKKAVEKTGVNIEFFTACIEWGNVPRYVFLTEFKETPHHERKKDLLRFIDEEIKVLNIEYAEKRDSERLGSPVLKVVRQGGFHRYRAKRVEAGTHDGQFKIPQLTKDMCFQNNFEIEEEIRF